MGKYVNLNPGGVAEMLGTSSLWVRAQAGHGRIPNARQQGPPQAGAGASRGEDRAAHHRGRRRALQPFLQLRRGEQAGT